MGLQSGVGEMTGEIGAAPEGLAGSDFELGYEPGADFRSARFPVNVDRDGRRRSVEAGYTDATL